MQNLYRQFHLHSDFRICTDNSIFITIAESFHIQFYWEKLGLLIIYFILYCRICTEIQIPLELQNLQRFFHLHCVYRICTDYPISIAITGPPVSDVTFLLKDQLGPPLSDQMFLLKGNSGPPTSDITFGAPMSEVKFFLFRHLCVHIRAVNWWEDPMVKLYFFVSVSVPSVLKAVGALQGVKSLPMRTVPSWRST